MSGAYLRVRKLRMCVQLDAAGIVFFSYSKPHLLKSGHSNIDKNNPNDKWQFNEGQKNYRMLPLEHSAILSTCIKR